MTAIIPVFKEPDYTLCPVCKNPSELVEKCRACAKGVFCSPSCALLGKLDHERVCKLELPWVRIEFPKEKNETIPGVRVSLALPSFPDSGNSTWEGCEIDGNEKQIFPRFLANESNWIRETAGSHEAICFDVNPQDEWLKGRAGQFLQTKSWTIVNPPSYQNVLKKVGLAVIDRQYLPFDQLEDLIHMAFNALLPGSCLVGNFFCFRQPKPFCGSIIRQDGGCFVNSEEEANKILSGAGFKVIAIHHIYYSNEQFCGHVFEYIALKPLVS